MYEVYLERSAENDLRRLPTTTFHRIIPRIRILAETQDLRGAARLPVQRTIGVLELEIIASLMRLMIEQRP